MGSVPSLVPIELVSLILLHCLFPVILLKKHYPIMPVEAGGTDVPEVGIDTVASSEGKATEPNVDETVWISMGYAWVTTIC